MFLWSLPKHYSMEPLKMLKVQHIKRWNWEMLCLWKVSDYSTSLKTIWKTATIYNHLDISICVSQTFSVPVLYDSYSKMFQFFWSFYTNRS